MPLTVEQKVKARKKRGLIDFLHKKQQKDVSDNEVFLDSEQVKYDTMVNLDVEDITLWKYKDRQSFECRDSKKFAQEILKNGQIAPIIVRPLKNGSNFKYEVIAGEQRWRAAKEAKIIDPSFKLKAIVKDIDDKEAFIIQEAENSERDQISDYSKALIYEKIIKDGIVDRKELHKKLNKSTQRISEILSFLTIPKEIWFAVNDMSKVTATAAAEIRSLSKKGDDYVKALVAIAEIIRDGASRHIIHKEVLKKLKITTNKKLKVVKKEIRSMSTKKTIFTWHKDNSGITFSAEVKSLMSKKKYMHKIELLLQQAITDIEKIELN